MGSLDSFLGNSTFMTAISSEQNGDFKSLKFIKKRCVTFTLPNGFPLGPQTHVQECLPWHRVLGYMLHASPVALQLSEATDTYIRISRNPIHRSELDTAWNFGSSISLQ